MTKTTFTFFLDFSFFSWSFMASLLQLFRPIYARMNSSTSSMSMHQNNKSVICYVVFFFFLEHVRWNWTQTGTHSAKITESSKPHIFLYISRWFDNSFKGISTYPFPWYFVPFLLQFLFSSAMGGCQDLTLVKTVSILVLDANGGT